MGIFSPDPPFKLAQAAWESGRRYFTPSIGDSNQQSTTPGATSIEEWAIAIEAIESIGWRLHTWHTVTLKESAGVTRFGHVRAQPLFVRPEG